MDIVITGASGLVGSALLPFLNSQGHNVTRLVRTPPRPGHAEIAWDPARHSIATPALENRDAIIHLAGENIAAGRWTAAKKAAIRQSRVQGTRVLCEALAQLVHPPHVLISASAIGYYGDRGEQIVRETSAPGTGFLADVCHAWEAAAGPARQRGIGVVHLRMGVILSPSGGALAKMLTPFRLGLGGVIGRGTQYMSWVALDDVIGAIHHVLTTPTLQGPVNVVSPKPVTNAVFTHTLGQVLGRPTRLPFPAIAARLAFGEMADALLLASTRVEPTQLVAAGYTFLYPDLAAALKHLLTPTSGA